MIDTPQITQAAARPAAVIRLTIPRAEIQQHMGPAIGEVLAAVAAQGLAPSGPLFSRHFRVDPDTFDFEVGIPVAGRLAPAGRVMPGEQPGGRVARTIYRGAYEGLGGGWGELAAWITAEGLRTGDDFWECYLSGPESSPDPAAWRTELNRALRG
jgi:effector-binding domain-containing protein